MFRTFPDGFGAPVRATIPPAKGVLRMEKIGRTSVSLETREAFQDGRRLQIGARAFDILELLIQANANLRVLSTSRESLRTRNETLHWVAPLPTPDVDATHKEMLASPSVETFLAFAESWTSDLTNEPENVDMIASVCRRLDGLPLALELAAARASVFGMRHMEREVARVYWKGRVTGIVRRKLEVRCALPAAATARTRRCRVWSLRRIHAECGRSLRLT